ncbi:YafY family protein [uncultured Brevundimonas sp.]|uniref:helix-turn-helix transcriptional regulator n=1 Tax=uncultured Brevundimonas sp. TaxID=213418 RepID=UPI0026213761|nr:YafY family protein [uncultured Brevundimonas sp.]
MGYVLKPGFMLPPLMFTPEEVEALVLGSRWVADRADARMRDAALGALARIAAVVPPDLRDDMETSALLVVPGAPFPVDVIDPGLLRKAIRTERRLKLCYRDEAGTASERVVWPFALAFFDRVRLMIAWCELRDDFRSFRTDRIVEAEVMEGRYPARRQVLLKTWREIHEKSKPAEGC